jgi:hypothetical protein
VEKIRERRSGGGGCGYNYLLLLKVIQIDVTYTCAFLRNSDV